MSDTAHPYDDWDAAYVLGALPPSERREYEGHLRTCDRCSAAVAELAAMPSLLARVPAQHALGLLEEGAAAEPVRDVLPGLLAAVRRRRRRRRAWWAAGAAAAAVAVAAALILPATLPASPDPVEIVLAATAPSPLSAEVELITESWGTRIEMTCEYRAGEGPADGVPWEYVLTVTDRSGRETVVSSWEAGPGDVVHATGAVDLAVADIATLEVRSSRTGDVLLRGEPPGVS